MRPDITVFVIEVHSPTRIGLGVLAVLLLWACFRQGRALRGLKRRLDQVHPGEVDHG